MSNEYSFLESHKINKVAKTSENGKKILKDMDTIPTNKSFLYALIEKIELLKNDNPELANQADELGAKLVRETNIDTTYRNQDTKMSALEYSLLADATEINTALSEKEMENRQGKTK